MTKTKLLLFVLLLCGSAPALPTGQCHSTGNNGAACTVDTDCTGGATPYCASLKHIIFIVKENRSFDQFFGRFPGVTGGPVGTKAVPYNCRSNVAGCNGVPPNGVGTMPAYAADPNLAEADCGHAHGTAIADIDGGLMDTFNKQCAGDTSWAHVYGKVCSDWATSHEACATNADCTNNSCTANTLSDYWGYATSYGLADHFFASITSPSYPTHLYIWAATTNEVTENTNTSTGTAPTSTAPYSSWSCDALHYGRCSNAATTLCSTSGDCTGGGTCSVNGATGKGYYNSATSCTTDADLFFTLTNIVGNGANATATCFTNCGTLSVGNFVTFAGNSVAAFNTSFAVASVTGSPVTSFTFTSTTNRIGTGGTAAYDYCTNQNVYAGKIATALSLDLLGKTGLPFAAGVCSTDNTKACTCSRGAGSNPTNPCTDTSKTCTGVANNCNPTRAISSTRGAQCPNVVTIADRLDAASVSWKTYNENGGELWNPASYISHIRYGSDWTNNNKTTAGQFEADASLCTSDASCADLPAVMWVNTGSSGTNASEHPTATMANGQAWTVAKVNAVLNNSYLKKHSVVFLLWDDWGGFHDHLAPKLDLLNYTNGIRVPALCIGPFCKNAVNKTVFTFSSLLKCIETQYGLAPINSSDSAAHDICTGAGGMVDLSLSSGSASTTGD